MKQRQERIPKKLEDLPDVLTVPQVASFLQIGRNLAYELVASGQIKGFKCNSAVRVSKRSLMEFIGYNQEDAAGAEGMRYFPFNIGPFRSEER